MRRREFLAGAAAGLTVGALGWQRPARGAHHAGGGAKPALAPDLTRALSESEFIYVSPLRSDGQESTCHGEVWYGWLDGHAVLITSKDSWKARSLARGLSRARIWVGNHGRWRRRLLPNNERFRQAPSFQARASFSSDADLLERLVTLYETKYPAEIANWRDRFRSGFRDGSRVLIRYAPA